MKAVKQHFILMSFRATYKLAEPKSQTKKLSHKPVTPRLVSGNSLHKVYSNVFIDVSTIHSCKWTSQFFSWPFRARSSRCYKTLVLKPHIHHKQRWSFSVWVSEEARFQGFQHDRHHSDATQEGDWAQGLESRVFSEHNWCKVCGQQNIWRKKNSTDHKTTFLSIKKFWKFSSKLF